MLPIRTVLHATDFTKSSDAAFRLAFSLARDYGARLLVMHVLRPATNVYDLEQGYLTPEALRRDFMAELRSRRPVDPSVQVEYRLCDGEPAAEILLAALENDCDVIVLGTHGHKGLGRLLLGSVSEKVLREATCPVVTVNASYHNDAPPEKTVRELAGTARRG